jgi:signal transduction histidine kinase/GAF domain-containing protein
MGNGHKIIVFDVLALAGRILECLNRKIIGLDLIREILTLIKEATAFSAVGIRLRDGDDFPYFETKGFSEEFVKAENYLCFRNKNGGKIYDKRNNPILECMCGNVLSGRTDPALPFFTERGSFWTNSTTRLLASTAPKDRQGRTRNRCNKAGYESVALIPLCCRGEIIGLLQFNDYREGCLSAETVRFFEEIAATIGIGMARIETEQKIETLAKFPSENPNPVLRISNDAAILYANKASSPVLDTWQCCEGEQIPEPCRKRLKDAFDSGKVSDFEFTCNNGRIFSVTLSPVVESGYVNAYGLDITHRKQADEALNLHETRLLALLHLNNMTHASEQEIQDFVREEVLAVTRSKLAFIGFMNNDESVMTIDNWSLEAMNRCAVVDKPMHFPISKAGLWGEVVRQRKPIIVNDYDADAPARKGYPKGHVRIKRFLSVPVFDNERIVAIGAIANKQENYEEPDVSALTSMMNDMWRLIKQKRIAQQIENLAKFPSENRSPVLRISNAGTLLYANPAADSIIKQWHCQIGQKVPRDWRSAVTQALANDRQRKLEHQHGDKIFAFLVVPVAQAGYANLYGRDITERRQAERQVESLAKFPSENPYPVLRIDKNGVVLYANEAGSELMAKSDFESRSRAPKHWKQYISRILKSDSSGELEISCGDKIFSLIVAPVENAGYVNLYGIDITARKLAEENLRKYRRHLEGIVEIRTAELTEANERLMAEIEGRKELEREILDISERERRRIGEELHDSLGQQLTGIAFMTKVLEQKLAKTSPNEVPDVAEIAKLVALATNQARGLAKGLYAMNLDAESFISSLEELARTTRDLIGVHCVFYCDKAVKVEDTSVAMHLYRIAQEAVNNAIKHGKAKKIEIGLACEKEMSVMTISNDGLDFPKEFETKGTGMGLQIMDHRADLIGGSLKIIAAKEGGTVVTCKFENKKNKG